MDCDATTRTALDLSSGWAFVRRRAGRRWLAGLGAAGGERVSLPHCWNAQDAFQDGVAYYRGPGAYRRVFRLPSTCPRRQIGWYLDSEGFYGTGGVWINGRHVGRVDGQYLGFRRRVDSWLEADGDNVIGVRLTNRCASDVLPGIADPDFLLYGGLSGRVRLLGLPALHLDEDETWVRAEFPEEGRAVLVVAFGVANHGSRAAQCTVEWRVLDAGGNTVAAAVSEPLRPPAGASMASALRLDIEAPRRWSIADPYLYRLQGVLADDAGGRDELRQRFGVREARFAPGNGFYLNGERVMLRGCNRHESMPGFGRALPMGQHTADAEQIKSAGLNFVRLSHYPQHPAFLDACDRLGLLVYAELASWKSVRGGRWLRAACRQFSGLIRRDRRHPAVILWGMGNEGRHRGAYRQLRALACALDGTRPVTYAENHLYRARRRRTVGLPDVWGLNYELGVLSQALEASRGRAVVVSECANYPHARRGSMVTELRQVQAVEEALAAVAAAPFAAGFALWCFNDYATLRKRRYRRFSGVVDAWRIPKMSWDLLRAVCLQEPVVAVHADWSEHGPPEREVHVFSNCDAGRVLVNGVEAAALAGRPHESFVLPFVRGTLRVVASREGRECADELRPWGDPRLIRLHARAGAAGSPDERTTEVWLDVHDAKGCRVRDWNGDVELAAEGPGRLCTFRPDGIVPLRGGCGRAFVRPSRRGGSVTIKAHAYGLEPGEEQVEFNWSGDG